MIQVCRTRTPCPIDWILIFGVVGYPIIAAAVEFLNLDSRTLTIPFRAILAFSSAIAVLGFLLRRPRFRLSIFWLAWFSFWAIYLARLLLDGRLNPDALQLPEWEYWVYAVGVSMLPAMAVGTRGGISDDARTMNRLILAGIAAILLTMAVLHVNYGLDLSSLSSAFLRAETETLNPIALGHLAATCIIVSLCGLLAKQTGRTKWFPIYFAALFFGVLGLIMSGSRGPVLSLVVVFAVALIRTKLIFKLVMGLIAIGAVVAVAINPSMLDFYFVERVTTQMWEDSTRIGLLAEAIGLITEHPIMGNGVDPMPVYPHNIIIEAFMVGGVVLGLLTIVLIGTTAIKVIQNGNVTLPGAWIPLLFIQYVVAAMVSGSLYIVAPMWILMAATVSMNAQTNRVPVPNAQAPSFLPGQPAHMT